MYKLNSVRVYVREKRKALGKKNGSKKISILSLLSTTSSCSSRSSKSEFVLPLNHTTHTHTEAHFHTHTQTHTYRHITGSEIRSINIYAYHCIFNITYTLCFLFALSFSLSRALSLSLSLSAACLALPRLALYTQKYI